MKGLVNKTGDILTDEKVAGLLSEYNVERMVSAKAPDTQEPLLVTTHGRVSQTSFLDPSTGKIHEFDHITREFTSVKLHIYLIIFLYYLILHVSNLLSDCCVRFVCVVFKSVMITLHPIS